MNIKTRPAKGHKPPWTMPKELSPINVDTLVIENAPMPTKRVFGQKKYAALFSKMKLGQNIRCKPDQVGRIGQALRKHIKDHKLNAMVISETHGNDGNGRVWLKPLAAKPE